MENLAVFSSHHLDEGAGQFRAITAIDILRIIGVPISRVGIDHLICNADLYATEAHSGSDPMGVREQAGGKRWLPACKGKMDPVHMLFRQLQDPLQQLSDLGRIDFHSLGGIAVALTFPAQ